MKRSIIALIIFAGICISTLLTIGIMWVIDRGVTSTVPTDKEKQLLLNVVSLEPFGVIDLTPTLGESYLKTINFGGSIEIEYEYDSALDSTSSNFLFFKSEAQIELTQSEARNSFNTSILAYKTGAFLSDNRQLVTKDDWFPNQDNVFAALVTQNDKPFGNVVVWQNKRIVHSLLILGLYFDDAEGIRTLLNPLMRRTNSDTSKDGEARGLTGR